MPTEYVLNKDTGLIFIVHDMMQIRSPLTPYLPTAAEILAGHKLVAAAPEPALDIEPTDNGRAELIAAAVAATPVDQYNKPAFGRPAMPKVSAIKLATKLDDVTDDEIIAAMEGL